MRLNIVGSGLSGATVARLAKDDGHEPIIFERRSVLGGNVRDDVHRLSGLRYNLYGPHYFRTNSENIWNFANRFSAFRQWAAEVNVINYRKFSVWPPADLGRPEFLGVPMNFEEACLSKMSREVYERWVKEYTEKQWGLKCAALLPSLANRIEARLDPMDRRLKVDKFQGLPIGGYSAWLEAMLDGIAVEQPTKTNQVNLLNESFVTVWTGSIDELCGFAFGPLPYRSQKRNYVYLKNIEKTLYPTVQTNFTSKSVEAIRAIEWKHLAKTRRRGSLITHEIPFSPTEPDQYEYPVPTKTANVEYRRYRSLAEALCPNFIFLGRLAEYKYYDMDQAIARAMTVYEKQIKPRLN